MEGRINVEHLTLTRGFKSSLIHSLTLHNFCLKSCWSVNAAAAAFVCRCWLSDWNANLFCVTLRFNLISHLSITHQSLPLSPPFFYFIIFFLLNLWIYFYFHIKKNQPKGKLIAWQLDYVIFFILRWIWLIRIFIFLLLLMKLTFIIDFNLKMFKVIRVKVII